MINGSYPPGVLMVEGLVPKDEGALAHVVVIAQSLALLVDALLHAVLEVLGLGVAFRLHHALQKDLLVLNAGRLVLGLVWADQVV